MFGRQQSIVVLLFLFIVVIMVVATSTLLNGYHYRTRATQINYVSPFEIPSEVSPLNLNQTSNLQTVKTFPFLIKDGGRFSQEYFFYIIVSGV